MPTPYQGSSTSNVADIPFASYGTTSYAINALLLGAKWGGPAGSATVLTYSFPTMSSTWDSQWYGGSYSNEPFYSGYRGLTVNEQSAFRAALQTWADVANITFVEVTETASNVGDIRVAFSGYLSNTTAAAWAYSPASQSYGGDIWIDPSYAPNMQLQPGQFGFSTMVHEIGHALGLDHPFNDDEDGEIYTLDGDYASQMYSIMGYDLSHYATIEAAAPMVYDILAIQYLYGANMSFHAGDDTYTFSNDHEELKAIWDAGGIDTFDLSNQTRDALVVLTPGKLSSIGETESGKAAFFNIGIAYGADIENVIGGSGNDRVIGNTLDNTLSGGEGDDQLEGGLGDDTLIGGAGSDQLDGGAGNDTYILADLNDTIMESPGNYGTHDTVAAAFNLSYKSMYWGIEEFRLLGTGNFSITGGSVTSLIGNAGNNTISGGGYLDGGAGDDVLNGGLGNDTYVIDSAGDVVTDAGGTSDKIIASLSTTLQSGIENLELSGNAGLSGTGNTLNNFLKGNSGSNTLRGLDGDDTLDGGTGADQMFGGAGNDTYYVDDLNDVTDESDGSGIDTVFVSGQSHTVGSGIENLVLSGSAGYAGTGNDLANSITGAAGNDVLDGKGGDDALDGKGGVDKLSGGAGNDIYYIDGDDTIIEAFDEGKDSVYASGNYTLSANLEDLTLSGGNISGTGNGLDNIITGTDGANVLKGEGGDDTLIGKAGSDIYYIDSLGDKIVEAAGASGVDTVFSSVDITSNANANVENFQLLGTGNLSVLANDLNNVIYDNAGANHIEAGGGNDTIYSSGGGDTLIGGAGNDVYILQAGGAIVVEVAGQGIDRVESSASYTLGADIEDLTLTGTATTGVGNELDNRIIGNASYNELFGGAGNDFISGVSVGDKIWGEDGNDQLYGGTELYGGAGNDSLNAGNLMDGGSGDDSYYVSVSTQVIVEAGNGGHDVVSAGVSYQLGDNVEDLYLLGNVNSSGTGNALGNTIKGTALDNVLDGGAGDDVLEGLSGNDTYIVDSVGDQVVEQAGGGDDTVKSATFSLHLSNYSNVENAALGGNADLDLDGDSKDNKLTGNSGANTLTGGQGNDTLDGGAGADEMIGGDGNDIYYIDDLNDVVIESASGGGYDTIYSSVDLDISKYANIEAFYFLGGTGYELTGDGSANILLGGSGNDVIQGQGGDDKLDGAAGNDQLLGGSGNDLLWDVSGSNVLDGGLGDDDLRGGVGSDTLLGGEGNDQLSGGGGADVMKGGVGDDYYIADATDQLVELDGEGNDTVETSQVFSVLAANMEGYVYTGSAALNFVGDGSANTVIGGSGSDIIYGGGGNDKLIGKDGSNQLYGQGGDDLLDGAQQYGQGTYDMLYGSTGNDTYIVGTFNSGWPTNFYAPDGVFENDNEGIDTVLINVGVGTLSYYQLGANVENLVSQSSTFLTLFGNALDNTIQGTGYLSGLAGNDELNGGSADDILDGGTGADRLSGGSGNDRYYVDQSDDTISDSAGIDAVFARSSYSLSEGLESLTLEEIATALNGTGNATANTISGNSFGNLLNGGGGADVMIGANGNDTYIVDNVADLASEGNLLAVGGVDLVKTSVSYQIGYAVENLELTGVGDINGTGNELANKITGNAGDNRLDGQSGKDILIGGLGNDTYVFDGADTITELAGGGIDTIETKSAITLSSFANIENVRLLGAANLNLVGTAVANKLEGNDGANQLDGGAGADVLVGGKGNDIYLVDNIGDSVIEVAGGGVDEVKASVSFVIGVGTDIEKFTLTGTANIAGSGNEIANTIVGNGGANALSGGGGADWLVGGAGNDSLDGGTGIDKLEGGAGDDTYDIDDPADMVVEIANAGLDTVRVSSAVDLASFKNVENATLTGTADVNATGNELANVLTGNAGENKIDGRAGNDVLDGKGGADWLLGGKGNDIYIVDNAGDLVDEVGGDGIDEVRTTISMTLAANVENLVITNSVGQSGAGNILNNKLSGGSGDDMLSGAGGNDMLIGNDGDDTLTGGSGIDTLIGGAGNDLYHIDLIQSGTTLKLEDTVTEAANAGTDTIYLYGNIALAMPATLALGANLENVDASGTGSTKLNLTGSAWRNELTGNVAANVLDGGAGDDVLKGGQGDDTLIGGIGNDMLAGGAGNDIYVIDSFTDAVDEGGNIDGGDEIRTSVAIADSVAGVENYTYVGKANWIFAGGTGNNKISGGSAIDKLSGGAGDDQLYGNAGDDELDGGADDDLLDGSAGNDILKGGAGNDTYVIDRLGDVIDDSVGADDLVKSTITYTLGNSLEHLTLLGNLAINGTGNGVANTITGNDGANLLDGRGGADTLIGGKGNDIYVVDEVGDVILESIANGVGGGIDTVKAWLTYDLGALANVDNVLLQGIGDFNATGNGLNNVLTGNDGSNILDGAGGNDTLIGGKGDDFYHVDLVFAGGVAKFADSVTEAAGQGDDRIYLHGDIALANATALTLGANIEHLDASDTNTTKLNITGNALHNELIGNDAANVVDGGAGNDILAGGNGGDTLKGGIGEDVLWGGGGLDILTGGAGRDHFVFKDASEGGVGETITDFVKGVSGDVLDLSDLLDGIGDPLGGGYVKFEQSGSDTKVMFDADGGADSFQQLVLIKGVSLTAADTDNLLL